MLENENKGNSSKKLLGKKRRRYKSIFTKKKKMNITLTVKHLIL